MGFLPNLNPPPLGRRKRQIINGDGVRLAECARGAAPDVNPDAEPLGVIGQGKRRRGKPDPLGLRARSLSKELGGAQLRLEVDVNGAEESVDAGAFLELDKVNFVSNFDIRCIIMRPGI